MIKKADLDLIAESTDNVLGEFLESSAEGLIESVAKIDIPDSVPVLGLAKLAIDTVRYVHDESVLKRIKKMREVMLSSERSEEYYSKMGKKDKTRLAELLVSEIEQQTHILQAEALGYLTKAYLLKEIGHDDFVGVAVEIKRLNPVIFGGDERRRIFQEANGLIFGPYELLPSIFTANHPPMGTDIVVDPGRRYLTDLGCQFYYLVYEKMVVAADDL